MSTKTAQYTILRILDGWHFVWGNAAWNFLPQGFMTSGLTSKLCQFNNGKLCKDLMKMLTPKDPTIDNFERMHVYSSNLPAGASIYNLFHYGQNMHMNQNGFQRWDFGSNFENHKAYGQRRPPQYNLGLLDFPIAIFSGDLDTLADPKDVKWTASQLQKNLVFNHEYHADHNTFMIGKDMSYFTREVMHLLNAANNKPYKASPLVRKW